MKTILIDKRKVKVYEFKELSKSAQKCALYDHRASLGLGRLFGHEIKKDAGLEDGYYHRNGEFCCFIGEVT